jgi:Flp pilus assembly protein TadB
MTTLADLFSQPINVVAALVAAAGLALVVSAFAIRMPAWSGRIAERLRELAGDTGDRFTGFAGSPLLDRLFRAPVEQAGKGLAAAAGDVDRDACLLLRAGYPSPFHTLGDFYGWKVVTAILFLVLGLLGAAVAGEPALAIAALGLGVFGLYLPDLTLRNRARERQEQFRTSLAFSLDHVAMIVEVGETPEDAIRHIADRGRGLFAAKMREVVDDLNLGQSVVSSLEKLREEFPLDEYDLFVNAVALSIVRGIALSTTLGQHAENILSDLEADLLGKGLRAIVPMTLGMGLAIIGLLILVGAPLMTQFFGW